MLLQNQVILGIWQEMKASAHAYEARIFFHQNKEQKGVFGSMRFAFAVVSCKAMLGKPCHSRPLTSGLREETIRVMDILISFEQDRLHQPDLCSVATILFFSLMGAAVCCNSLIRAFGKLKSVENEAGYRVERFMLVAGPEDAGSTVCFHHLRATCVLQWMTTAWQHPSPRVGLWRRAQPLSGLLCIGHDSDRIKLIIILFSTPLIRPFCQQLPLAAVCLYFDVELHPFHALEPSNDMTLPSLDTHLMFGTQHMAISPESCLQTTLLLTAVR